MLSCSYSDLNVIIWLHEICFCMDDVYITYGAYLTFFFLLKLIWKFIDSMISNIPGENHSQSLIDEITGLYNVIESKFVFQWLSWRSGRDIGFGHDDDGCCQIVHLVLDDSQIRCVQVIMVMIFQGLWKKE